MTTKLTTSNFSSTTLSTIVFPTVSSIVVTDNTYTATGTNAVALTGGYIKITGTGFVSGATVYIDSIPATSTISGTPQLNAAQPLTVGGSNSLYYNGYIDDLRITKGIARYTGTFTPPGAPLLN